MTSQPGRQTIAIHILPYVSRSNFLKNFLKDCLEKSYPKCGGEKIVPNSFLNNKNWADIRINSLKFYTVYLYGMPSCGLSK